MEAPAAEEKEAEQRERRAYADDDISRLGWVQTPTSYFEDCVELNQLKDPCGHRNSLYFDAVQCGMDGYGSATLLSSNALIRRSALDSIGGMQYGSFTEGQLTGLRLHAKGWDSAYFRKDWEGDIHERFPLIVGLIPESVAATMKQRQRVAQGLSETFLRVPLTHGLVDAEWEAAYHRKHPVVCPPLSRPLPVRLMRLVFFFNEFCQPLASLIWFTYVIIILYMLFMGTNPFYVNSSLLLACYVPYIGICAVMNRVATRPVAVMEAVKGAETGYSFAWCNIAGVLSALWVRLTCKQSYKKRWGTQGAVKYNTSLLQLPNVCLFFSLLVGLGNCLAIFFTSKYSQPWQVLPAIALGTYVLFSLWPIVRLTVQEYLGWSVFTLHDKGHMTSAVALAVLAAWASLWKYVYVQDQGSILL